MNLEVVRNVSCEESTVSLVGYGADLFKFCSNHIFGTDEARRFKFRVLTDTQVHA